MPDYSQYFKTLYSTPEWSFLLLLIILFWSIYLLVGRRKPNFPPGPTGLPFIGYYPFLDKKETHKQFSALARKYGDIFSLNLGGHLVVVCNSWESVKDVYGHSATANRPPRLFHALRYGLGLGSENGHAWTVQRRFTVRSVKDLGLGTSKWEDFLQEEVKETVQSLRAYDSRPVDMTPFLIETFTNNILTLLFGYRLPSGHKIMSFIGHSVDVVVKELSLVKLSNYLPDVCGFLGKLGLYGSAESKKALDDFVHFTEKFVKQRLVDHEHDDEDSFIKTYNQQIENYKDKETSNIFSDTSLYANSQALLLGGTETSRTSFIWLLTAISEHPEIQQQVHKEIDDVLGKDGKISWAERSKIPFTYACIMEALRRYPTVPVNALRMTVEDLKVAGYDIPKGSYITANIWAIHQDTRYWKEPEKFNPTRFIIDNGKKVNYKPESYNPFSYGKRSCPGEQIALMEILCYFTNIMQNFLVLPESGDKVKFGSVLGLTHQATGVKLRFISRDNNVSEVKSSEKIA